MWIMHIYLSGSRPSCSLFFAWLMSQLSVYSLAVKGSAAFISCYQQCFQKHMQQLHTGGKQSSAGTPFNDQWQDYNLAMKGKQR